MASLPKPPGQRRRRNKAPVFTKLPANQGARNGAPELPGAADLLPSTRDWWATIWSSPMSAAYLDADVPALVRLAGLIDSVSRGELGGVTTQRTILALEDRFGLSPAARRRLQWEVDQARGAAAPVDDSSNVVDMDRWQRAST